MDLRGTSCVKNYPLKEVAIPKRYPFKAASMDEMDEEVTLGPPFMHLDHFHMDKPTFGVHPHAGFCACTLMLLESEGSFVTRDTANTNPVTLKPGGAQLSFAGSGIQHEEIPQEFGVNSRGLQLFVNVPSSQRNDKPFTFHLDPEEVPESKTDAFRVRVWSGQFQPSDGEDPVVNTKVKLPIHVGLLDCYVSPSQLLNHILPPKNSAFVRVISGAGEIMTAEGNIEVKADDSVGLPAVGDNAQEEAESFVFKAGPDGAHIFLGHGEMPSGQAPGVWASSLGLRQGLYFNNEDECKEADRRYHAGEFGTFDPTPNPPFEG